MARKIEYKVFGGEIKSSDDDQLIIEHFISTETKDRHGDIMRASGMQIVGKPVVLLLHGRGSALGSEPVAKPLAIEPGKWKGMKGILARTQFFPDDTGRRLYQKAKDGYAPNWSIGYMVEEAKDIMEHGHYVGSEILKWQLLEYSLVGVPANPDATGPAVVPTKKDDEEIGLIAFKMVEPGGPESAGEPEEANEKEAQDPPATDPEAPPVENAEKGDPDPMLDPEPEEEDMLATLAKNIADLAGIVKSLESKLEDILTAVPAEQATPGEPAPEGGEAKDGTEADNPPDVEVVPQQAEPRQPPRLVFVRSGQNEVVAPPAPRRLTVEDVQQIVKGAFELKAKEDINRMRGKVP